MLLELMIFCHLLTTPCIDTSVVNRDPWRYLPMKDVWRYFFRSRYVLYYLVTLILVIAGLAWIYLPNLWIFSALMLPVALCVSSPFYYTAQYALYLKEISKR